MAVSVSNSQSSARGDLISLSTLFRAVTEFILVTNSTFSRSGDDEELPGRAGSWHQVQVHVGRQELSEQHHLPWDTLGTRGYLQRCQGKLNVLLLELPNSLRGLLALHC